MDQPLEDLMQGCLPGGQQVASSQICIWAQALETDTAYALQLQDTGQSPAQARFNRSFTTSHFPSLTDHAEYVQNLFATAVQVPIQNDFVASLFLRQTVMPVTSGAVQGFDHAIETLYRKVVNIDGGRLGDFYGRTGEDFVAYLVTNAGTSPKVWGIVIELAEPLLGKDGVQLLDQVGSTANQARGLYFTLVNNQERLVLRDRSGSRVVILNSANGVMFAPIQTYTLLNLAFDQEEAVEISVRDYVGDTLLHMDDTEQTVAVAEIMNRLRSQPALAPILTPVPASLTIPLPLGSFTGTLFKTSTTTASLVAPKLGLASNGKRQSQRRLRQSRRRFDSRKFPDTI
jgi:hypothetical protein